MNTHEFVEALTLFREYIQNIVDQILFDQDDLGEVEARIVDAHQFWGDLMNKWLDDYQHISRKNI